MLNYRPIQRNATLVFGCLVTMGAASRKSSRETVCVPQPGIAAEDKHNVGQNPQTVLTEWAQAHSSERLIEIPSS